MSDKAEITKKLPWLCSEHPRAEIRCSWDRTVYQIRGGEQGRPFDSNYHYYCSICGKELAASKKESEME